MSQRTKDILEGIFGATLVTIGAAGLGVVLFYFSGLDPRNDFWGATLANIGVVVAVISVWIVGIVRVYDTYWASPDKLREHRAKTAKYYR